MKRLIIAALIIAAGAGSLAAQGWDYGHPGRGWYGQTGTAQTLTVTGTVQLQNGAIAVNNGSTVYYVPALQRYIGFIDSLKEGAQVTIEGYSWSGPNYPYLEPNKLTIGGKDYDLQPRQNGNGYTIGHHGCGHW